MLICTVLQGVFVGATAQPAQFLGSSVHAFDATADVARGRIYLSQTRVDQIQVCDLETLAPVGEIDLGIFLPTRGIALSGDGDELYVTVTDHKLRVVDLDTGTVESIFLQGLTDPASLVSIEDHSVVELTGDRVVVAASGRNPFFGLYPGFATS